MEKDIKSITKEIRRNSNINSTVILIFFALMFVISYIGEPLAKLFVSNDSKSFDSIHTLVVYTLLYAVGVPFSLLIMKLMKRKDGGFKVTESFRKPQMSAGWIAKWVLISVGMTYVVSFASNIIFTLIEMLSGVDLKAATFSTDSTLLDKLVNFFAVTILAPIFEELLFRASNYRNCMKYGAWSMAIISGLTFGLWHSNYSQTFYTALLGIFSCLMYAKTKSIIPSIITHFCLNLIGGLQLVFVDYSVVDAINAGESVSAGDMLGTFAVMMIFVLIIIGLAITGLVLFIIELVKHRDSFRLENELSDVSAVKKTLTYLTAPMTIIMFLAFIAVTVINALYLEV